MTKSEISNNIFTFQTNFNIFFNKIKIETIKLNEIDKIKDNIDFLNDEFNKLELKLTLNLSSKILEQLKLLKCDEEFVFEKADLIVSIFSIKEDIEKLLKV